MRASVSSSMPPSGARPSVVALEELPEAVSSEALSINGVGQAVGDSYIDGETHAVEWIGGSTLDLGGLQGGLHVQSSERHQQRGTGSGR